MTEPHGATGAPHPYPGKLVIVEGIDGKVKPANTFYGESFTLFQ